MSTTESFDAHILCLSRDWRAHVAMEWVPEGGSRNRGRSTKAWRKTFIEGLAEMEDNWNAKAIVNE